MLCIVSLYLFLTRAVWLHVDVQYWACKHKNKWRRKNVYNSTNINLYEYISTMVVLIISGANRKKNYICTVWGGQSTAVLTSSNWSMHSTVLPHWVQFDGVYLFWLTPRRAEQWSMWLHGFGDAPSATNLSVWHSKKQGSRLWLSSNCPEHTKWLSVYLIKCIWSNRYYKKTNKHSI